MINLLWIRALGYAKRILNSRIGRYIIIAICVLISLKIFAATNQNKGREEAEKDFKIKGVEVVEEQYEKGEELREAKEERRVETEEAKEEIDEDVQNVIEETKQDPVDDSDFRMSDTFADRLRNLQEKHSSDSSADPD